MSSMLSKEAVVLVDAGAVGKLYGFEFTETAKAIIEHLLSGGDPDLVDVDEINYSFKWDAAYLADTYGTKLRAGTSFSWVIQPAGAGTGNPRITLTGGILTRRNVRFAKGTVIMESCEGVAKSITVDTIPA